MSSPVWQFQMGDPEALNSANTQFQFLPFHHGMSLQNVIFTCAAIIIQILMARISWARLKTFNKNNSCHSIQTMWNVQKEHNRQKDNLKWLLIFICRAFIWKKTKISSFGRLQFQRNWNILFVKTILNCKMFK